jgi:hypothetical protein
MSIGTFVRQLAASLVAPPAPARNAPRRRGTSAERLALERLEGRLVPATLGTTTLVEGPSAGTGSDPVVTSGAWTATADAPWLHTTASGTSNGDAAFGFDADTGATRTGTLTIAGQTLTVIQAGSTYVPVAPVTTLASELAATSLAVDAVGDAYFLGGSALAAAVEEYSAATHTVSAVIPASDGVAPQSVVAVDAAGGVYFVEEYAVTTGGGDAPVRTNEYRIVKYDPAAQQATVVDSGWSEPPTSQQVYAATGATAATTDAQGDSFAVTPVPGSGGVLRETTRAFVPAGPVSEPAAAGTDELPPVLPAAVPLTGPSAPTADAPWLTVGTPAGGSVPFAVTANAAAAARTAHITMLGRTITVTQAAPPPVVQFAAAGETADANSASFGVTVELSAPTDRAVAVPYTLGGTAVAGADYTDTTGGVLTIAAGGTSGTIVGTLQPDDGFDKTLTISLGTPAGATPGPLAVNTLTIVEPLDAPPIIEPVFPPSVPDGGAPLSIAVRAVALDSGARAEPLTYALGAGAPAGAAIDPQTGVLTWSPSEAIGIEPGFYTVPVIATEVGGRALSSTEPLGVLVTPTSSAAGSGAAARARAALGLTTSAECYADLVAADYQKYLGRTPTGAEVAPWAGRLASGALTDEQFEAALLSSGEFLGAHGGAAGAEWIEALFQVELERIPAPADVQSWLATMAGGNLTPGQVALGFATSTEADQNRVTADYRQDLGRAPQSAEVQNWVRFLQSGGTDEQLQAQFVSSQEFFQNHGGDVVDWLYGSYRATLNREPDAAGFRSAEGQL